jgi:hypothetical protein
VLEHIESLRPRHKLIEIQEARGANRNSSYEVNKEEPPQEKQRRHKPIERRDEKPFAVVAEVSALGERGYTLFARPFLKSLVNEGIAELGRAFHPLRWQRWALSDLNPLLWPLPALVSIAKAGRRAAPADNPYRQVEKAVADGITAGLDLYRDLRDAAMEAWFFQIYGPPVVLGVLPESVPEAPWTAGDPRELPVVREALATIGTGGYPEAVALIGALLGRRAGRIPLGRLELVEGFIRGDEVLSRLSADAVRRLRAEQAVVAELEPERGLQSLPRLLTNPADRQRVLAAMDEAVVAVVPTPEQEATLERIRSVLGAGPAWLQPEEIDGAPLESFGAT